jgi:hypothetical protein
MMSEWIDHAAESPTVFFSNRDDVRCASRYCLGEDGIWIRNRQHHSNRSTSERLGTEVAVLGRLIAHPEFGAIYREPGHYTPSAVKPEDFRCSESRFVEIDGSRTIPNR